MRFRNLRIAFSVTCLIACVLLIALWVRSYWWVDAVAVPISSSDNLGCWSVEGTVAAYHATHNPGFFKGRWIILRHHIVNRRVLDERPQVRSGYHGPIGFGVMQSRIPYAPHWFLVFMVGMLAAAPWIRWRFSLRTLLIATTLIALVLGAIGYAAR